MSCIFALSHADAYQTPVDPGKQWKCSKDDARRWYTVTFCPRGSVLVDDRDELAAASGTAAESK